MLTNMDMNSIAKGGKMVRGTVIKTFYDYETRLRLANGKYWAVNGPSNWDKKTCSHAIMVIKKKPKHRTSKLVERLSEGLFITNPVLF